MKKCSFCAEEIQDAAVVCKHCQREVGPQPSERPGSRLETPSTTDKAPSLGNPSRRRGFGLLAVFVGFLLSLSSATVAVGIFVSWLGIAFAITGSSMLRWAGGLILALVVAALGIGIGGSLSDAPTSPAVPASSSPPTATAAPPTSKKDPELDAGAFLACREFAPLAQDANAGLLTQTEFRDGMKKVYDKARVWPDSEVTRASAALLLIFTESGAGKSVEERDRISKERFLALMKACSLNVSPRE